MLPAASEQPHKASATSLDLFGIPAVFTQDTLLDTHQFIDEAKKRGLAITLDDLQDLHARSMLLPLFRVSDTASEGRRIGGGPRILSVNAYGWVWEAAMEGRLHDPYHEGYSAAWPYRRHQDEDPRNWWNGFVYSPWQLIELPHALSLRNFATALGHRPNHHQLARNRRTTLVLTALSVKYLPTATGRMIIPTGMSDSEYWKIRTETDVADLIKLTGVLPEQLRPYAEHLLGRAHSNDPMIKWLPLARHASYDAWMKLKDQPLACMWLRIAAEVLLLAHDDMATTGIVPPLPDFTGTLAWTALHDRLSHNHVEADTLERTLGDFDLSPHPKVLVLVEGKTELRHIPRLLAEVGLSQPHQVRVQSCDSSRVNPQLIARYNITPRVGRRIGGRWLLNATGTALVIAMDPENNWATMEKRDAESKSLREAIRRDVRDQGADIGDDYLDLLVNIHVWGDDKYELANFTDDELVTAAIALTDPATVSAAWENELRDRLADARVRHVDIKIPFGPMRIPIDKPRLADLLWPALLTKLQTEFATDHTPNTPVIRLIDEVIRIHHHMAGIRAMKDPGSTAEDV